MHRINTGFCSTILELVFRFDTFIENIRKMTNKSLLSSVLAIIFAVSTTFGQQNEPIENSLHNLMQEYNAVGLAVAVVKDGQIHYEKSLGLKNMESEELLNRNDVFRIASISKSFAATAIMQLVEQQLISLDDDFGDLLGIPIRNPKFPDQKITLRMVMSHTSSINDSEGYFQLNVIDPEQNEDWAKCYNDYAPGENYMYCNLNYNMIGAVIERITNQRYDQYIIENILQPLGLYGGYAPDLLDSNLFATLYTYQPSTSTYKTDANAYHPRRTELSSYKLGQSTPVLSPTGGLKISASDLAKYMIMHMNYGTVDDVTILSEASARIMQIPVSKAPSNYGLALNVSERYIPGVKMVGHTGSAYGLFSNMYFNPDEQYGFVIITNGSNNASSGGFVELLHKTAQLLHKQFIE